MSTQYWTDQLFWSTPIVYEAMDTFGLDERVVVEFVDPNLDGPGWLAWAQWVAPMPWDHGHGLIQFSRYWWQRLSVEERRQTLVHEAAHIIDHCKRGLSGHDLPWQLIMVRLGEDPHEFYQGHVTRVLMKKDTV
jgi:hypothetical protein